MLGGRGETVVPKRFSLNGFGTVWAACWVLRDVFIGCSNMFWHLLPAFLPEVTRILLFAAQASHQLVPPEVSVPPVMDVKWAAGQHGNATDCVDVGRGKGNWSDCLEKLMVITAIFASSVALFHKGGWGRYWFYFLQENSCLENNCGLYWHVLMCLSMKKDLSVNNIYVCKVFIK